MVLDKIYKLEEAVSKEDMRPAMTGIFFDIQEKRAVVTDGHILAAVPVKMDKTDCGGIIPVEAIKQARKVSQSLKRDSLSLEMRSKNIALDGLGTTHLFNKIDVQYPNYKAVIPDKKDCQTFKIAFNSTLLSKLSKALGSECVELNFGASTKAIRVYPNDPENKAYGLLMPVKNNNNSEEMDIPEAMQAIASIEGKYEKPEPKEKTVIEAWDELKRALINSYCKQADKFFNFVQIKTRAIKKYSRQNIFEFRAVFVRNLGKIKAVKKALDRIYFQKVTLKLNFYKNKAKEKPAPVIKEIIKQEPVKILEPVVVKEVIEVKPEPVKKSKPKNQMNYKTKINYPIFRKVASQYLNGGVKESPAEDLTIALKASLAYKGAASKGLIDYSLWYNQFMNHKRIKQINYAN